MVESGIFSRVDIFYDAELDVMMAVQILNNSVINNLPGRCVVLVEQGPESYLNQ